MTFFFTALGPLEHLCYLVCFDSFQCKRCDISLLSTFKSRTNCQVHYHDCNCYCLKIISCTLEHLSDLWLLTHVDQEPCQIFEISQFMDFAFLFYRLPWQVKKFSVSFRYTVQWEWNRFQVFQYWYIKVRVLLCVLVT